MSLGHDDCSPKQEMEISNSYPLIATRLQNRKERLEKDLRETNEAIKIIKANPGIEQTIDRF